MAVTERETIVPPPALLSRVSWGAIFAGAVSAVALTALFGLLGLGIGFASLDPAEAGGLNDVPKSTLIWWAVTSILSTGIGGFVAARLAGIPRSMTGALHGLAVWSVATILTLWLATTAAGALLGAASSVVTTTARVTTSAVGTVGGAAVDAGGTIAPSGSEVEGALRDRGVTRDRIRQEANDIARSAGIGQQDLAEAQNAVGAAAQNMATNPGTAGAELDRLIDRLFEGPNAVLSPQERDQLVNEIVARSGMSRDEAQRVADRWQAQASAAGERVNATGQQIRSDAGQLGEGVLDVMSKIAWGMFLISLAGLVAALVGAAFGAPSLIAAAAGARDRDYRDDEHDHRHDEHRHDEVR